jgi:arginine metabolism regulation protein II
MFSALAISAFNLDGLGSSGGGGSGSQTMDWGKLGQVYRERANRRLKSSLLVLSTAQTKKEKFKDILMALLSMITICVSMLSLPQTSQ